MNSYNQYSTVFVIIIINYNFCINFNISYNAIRINGRYEIFAGLKKVSVSLL